MEKEKLDGELVSLAASFTEVALDPKNRALLENILDGILTDHWPYTVPEALKIIEKTLGKDFAEFIWASFTVAKNKAQEYIENIEAKQYWSYLQYRYSKQVDMAYKSTLGSPMDIYQIRTHNGYDKKQIGMRIERCDQEKLDVLIPARMVTNVCKGLLERVNDIIDKNPEESKKIDKKIVADLKVLVDLLNNKILEGTPS